MLRPALRLRQRREGKWPLSRYAPELHRAKRFMTSVFSLSGQVDGVTCFCFSSDGKRLFSCGSGGTLNVWDLQNRVKLLTFHGADKYVAMSPDGKRLVTFGDDSKGVQVWETELLSPEERWKRHLERIPFWQRQETRKPETGSRP